MAKKKKSLIFKLAVVAIPLIVIQAGYQLFFWEGSTESTRMSLDNAVSKVSGLDDRRKTLMKIQLALEDYMSRHGGMPPDSLDRLRPEYFDVLPMDPSTGAAFSYKVDKSKPLVGFDLVLTSKKGAPGSKEAEAAAPEIEPDLISFVYDPTGKRDPFRPFDFSMHRNLEGKTALERYEYGQLKLTAVLEGFEEPTAIVENNVGRGFTVKKGTKIGPNGGEVIEIQKDRLFILETAIDFTGEKKTTTHEMKLRTKDQERRERAE